MRLTSKGQVTIPLEIREKLGLHPGTAVEFEIVDGAVRIRKAGTQNRRRDEVREWIARVRGAGRHSRVQLTTDQIMALTRGDE